MTAVMWIPANIYRMFILLSLPFLLTNAFKTDHTDLDSILADTGFSSLDEAIRISNTASYAQFFGRTWTVMKNLGGSWNCSNVKAAERRVQMGFSHTNKLFFASVLTLSVFLTCIRFLITPGILGWAKRCQLKPSEVVKVPESVWKGTMHSIMWMLSFYVVILSGHYSFFHEPCSVWDDALENDNFFSDSPPLDLQLLYALQLSHYIHSVFATIFMDSWRADSRAMLFHHLLTICLIALSYLQRLLGIGSLVMFLHDISDVLLEFTKLNVYFKSRNGKLSQLHRCLSDFGFIGFASSWALFRLYWFPLKVLHASNWCSYLRIGCIHPSDYVVFNTMLCVLQLLHIYWFWFILVLLFKIITGQLTEIEDIRDLPEGDLGTNVDKSSKQIAANGSASVQQDGESVSILRSRKSTQFSNKSDADCNESQ